MKENPQMFRLVSAVLIMLTIALGVQAWKGVREAKEVGRVPRDRDMITIAGEGKVSGKPDLARVDIGLLSEGGDVPRVQTQNTTKVNAMIGALRDLGIQEADIQTSNYNISPKYRYDEGRQSIEGYIVSQNVSVKVRDLSKIGAVLARMGELGANQINGVFFTIDDPSSLEQDARKEAIEDAREKADELARALGVKVVRVVTFSESSGGTPPPIPYGLKSFEADQAIAPEIQPGSLDVTSVVSVTFEIR